MSFKKRTDKLKKLSIFLILITLIYVFLLKGLKLSNSLKQIQITPIKTFLLAKKLIIENQKLAEENLRLSIENSKLKNDKAFILNDQLNSQQAFIILRLSTHQGQYFIINARCNNIQSNKTVVTYDKFLIGRVVKCNQDISKVELVTNNNFKASVKSLTSNINGLFETVKNEYRITIKDSNKEIENDELIVTSGQDGLYPAGLIIGKYKKNRNAVELLVDLNSISKVSLININVE